MILLTAIDPLAGFLLFTAVFLTVQLLFNLIWWGLLRLMKFKVAVTWGKLFALLFLSTALLTIIAASHNAMDSFDWLRKIQSLYSPNRENSKIQPLELIGFWSLISLLITFSFRQKKGK